MAIDFTHTPVLAREITGLFAGLPSGVIVDATLGGAGHATLLLGEYPQLRLLGIDRDPAARQAAEAALAGFGGRSRVVAGTFGDWASVLADQREFVGADPLVGALFDLGVSSPQLDDPERGFSFRSDAPLDMRMDPTRGRTAAELIEAIDERDLARLLHHHGETRFAGAIARSIVQRRPRTTGELVAAVEHAVPPAARRRGHVATRAFQALRVEINDEENQLTSGLDAALDALAVGGVIVVVSYHSGEDRVVKSVLHEAATGGCHCPPELGCVCGAVPRVRLLKASAVMAGSAEIAENPRARSARLRAAWKVAP